jgi:hypothetical protein
MPRTARRQATTPHPRRPAQGRAAGGSRRRQGCPSRSARPA